MWGSGSLSLYLEASPLAGESLGVTLAVGGVVGSGQFGGVTLYTFSDGAGREATLPLYLKAVASDAAARNMNLWVQAEYPSAHGSVDLFAYNTGVWAQTPLFVAGAGTQDGAAPWDGSMPLFVRRAPTHSIDLYVLAPGDPAASGVPFYLYGSAVGSGYCDLVVTSVGYEAEPATLYTHGF